MPGITEWARDLLISRGALVETDEDTAAVRALLAPELARALGSNDWLSLRFGSGAGADDESHWLERPVNSMRGVRTIAYPGPLTGIDSNRGSRRWEFSSCLHPREQHELRPDRMIGAPEFRCTADGHFIKRPSNNANMAV